MSMPLTIMVAPNGARRMKADHSELPITIDETARDVARCAEAGASAAHVHVRDREGRHVLDADLYREVAARIHREAGTEMVVQATTEAVGLYSAEQQIAMVRDLKPRAVSVGMREILSDEASETPGADFYDWAVREEIAVQHILYDAEDFERFLGYARRGIIAGDRWSLLFVLGRYTVNQESDPNALREFLEVMDKAEERDRLTWMMCAFGRGETASAAAAMALGGHVRVGFENSLWTPDNVLRADNAESVDNARRCADILCREKSDRETTLDILGRP